MLGKKNNEKLTEREQVALRRKEVLSRGRKFKYPLQYAKHHVAIIATAISVVAVITLATLAYASLYKFGSTHEVLYHLTQIFPVPVAEVAGEPVRFSDYLLLYRSSIAVIDQNTEGFDNIIAEYKRGSLDSAEKYSYAEKLASELDISVTDEEVDELFESHRRAGGTEHREESFLKILKDNFGIDKSEYNRLLRLLLTKMKVSIAIDDNAAHLRDEAAHIISVNGGNLADAAESLGGTVSYEDTGGLLELGNIDGGRSTVAFSMERDQISEPFISSSGDAYYIVKLLDKTDTEVSYASVRIPLTEFDRRFAELISNGDYREFITISEPSTEKNNSDEPAE